MDGTIRKSAVFAAIIAAAWLTNTLTGQDAPTTQPTTQPSAEQVQQELQRSIRPYPEDRPKTQSAGGPSYGNAPPITAPMEINRAVIGPAPGEPQPTLVREGQFIVNRRGHIQRTGAGGGQVLFVFEADNEQSPETPMVLVPCQMLQNMEDIVYERGETTTFLLSGQVLTYRGTNYLLPSMMKIALDRGNLQP